MLHALLRYASIFVPARYQQPTLQQNDEDRTAIRTQSTSPLSNSTPIGGTQLTNISCPAQSNSDFYQENEDSFLQTFYECEDRPDQRSEMPFPFLDLPAELRGHILRWLPLSDALHLRLACKTLNHDVEGCYPHFSVAICGDTLNSEQMDFITRINLQNIVFKRVAKPLHVEKDAKWSRRHLGNQTGRSNTSRNQGKSSMCSRKGENVEYLGPTTFYKVGGIQVRSISAPVIRIKIRSLCPGRKPTRRVYDFQTLRQYLLRIGGGDIFMHI